MPSCHSVVSVDPPGGRRTAWRPRCGGWVSRLRRGEGVDNSSQWRVRAGGGGAGTCGNAEVKQTDRQTDRGSERARKLLEKYL